jgi:hypothetical protein
MAKEKIHRDLDRVQEGRGDGWRVWTGLMDCSYCGYAQEAGVSMAMRDCNRIELRAGLVSNVRQKQRDEKGHTSCHSEETGRGKDVYQRLSSGFVKRVRGITL